MKKSMILRGLLATAALAALLGADSGASAGSVPHLLTHQGRLYDSMGMPITGMLDVQFNLYDAASGGMSLWSETITITFDDGYFSASLGAKTPLKPVIDGSSRSPLAPRYASSHSKRVC